MFGDLGGHCACWQSYDGLRGLARVRCCHPFRNVSDRKKQSVCLSSFARGAPTSSAETHVAESEALEREVSAARSATAEALVASDPASPLLPDARDELSIEMIALRKDLERPAERVLVLESQPSAPTESSDRRGPLESVESIGFVALMREEHLMLISGIRYMGNDMSNFPTLAASDKADQSALELTRMLRLLAKAEYAADLATVKGEITSSESALRRTTRAPPSSARPLRTSSPSRSRS